MSRFGFHNIKNEKYERWFFIPMIIMVTVPLIIMGIIAYSIYYQGEVRDNNQRLEAFCENTCMEYDNILMAIKTYYIDAAAKDDFKWMHTQKNIPYSKCAEIKRVQSLLEGNYLLMDYVENYNYINVEKRWVLTKYGMFPYDKTKNISEVDKFLEEQDKKESNVYWLNQMDVESPYKDSLIESRMIDLSQKLFIIKEYNVKGELSYILIVQLDADSLNKIVEKNSEFKTVILSQEKEFFGKMEEFTEDYVTVSKESSLYGFTCISGYDKASLKETSMVFVWVSIVFAAVISIIILVIRYLSILFAVPIRYFKGIAENKNVQIKELFVASLMSGKNGFQDKEIKERLSNMEISEWPLYRMVTVRLKKDNSAALAEEIVRKLPEEIMENVFVVPVRKNENMIFLVGETEEFKLDEKTASLYEQIKKFILENYKIPISAGISRSTSRLSGIQYAHEECMEALHNNINRKSEHSTFIVYDDYCANKEHKPNSYDIVIQNELVTAIEKGNKEEAYRLLNLALDILENREVAGVERNVYLMRLITAMLAVAQNKGYLLNDIFINELYEDVSYFTRIYDKEILKKHIYDKIIDPLLSAMGQKEDDEDKNISRMVVRMIKETKGAISLSECAEKVNYHVNHVGKLLKRDTGKTFSELVNEEKMEVAKYLLLTTDYSVAEIAEKLSYNNVQNFIRFFKANAQITPSAFRKNHRP